MRWTCTRCGETIDLPFANPLLYVQHNCDTGRGSMIPSFPVRATHILECDMCGRLRDSVNGVLICPECDQGR